MLCLSSATPVAAQLAAAAPPGPYTVDIRGAISGLPADAGFYPSAPTGTNVPGRGPGLDVGAHFYPWQLGIARLGMGVALLRARGSASAAVASAGTGTSAATTPDADMTLTALTPQLSFNFGTSAGWSYLSAGVGRARIASATSAFGTATSEDGVTAADEVNSGFRNSVNIGAGARWFAKPRLGVSFDLRVLVISAGRAGAIRPATPRATVTVGSVGISVR
jgi:hypothetical protein